jgi:hypothetical protein
MLTSALCAILLLRAYRREPTRLLLWSSFSFVGWAVANALVFADLVVLPTTDLSLARTWTSIVAVALLLWGLVWDAA